MTRGRFTEGTGPGDPPPMIATPRLCNTAGPSPAFRRLEILGYLVVAVLAGVVVTLVLLVRARRRIGHQAA